MAKRKLDQISTDDLFSELASNPQLINDPARVLRISTLLASRARAAIHEEYNKYYSQIPTDENGPLYDKETHMMAQVIHSQQRLLEAREECAQALSARASMAQELAETHQKLIEARQVVNNAQSAIKNIGNILRDEYPSDSDEAQTTGTAANKAEGRSKTVEEEGLILEQEAAESKKAALELIQRYDSLEDELQEVEGDMEDAIESTQHLVGNLDQSIRALQEKAAWEKELPAFADAHPKHYEKYCHEWQWDIRETVVEKMKDVEMVLDSLGAVMRSRAIPDTRGGCSKILIEWLRQPKRITSTKR